MYAPTTHAERSTDPDNYPLEPSPSTDTFATAEVNHAPDAHTVSEYHEPPADLEEFDTMLRDSFTLEVAL
jgi:hypothetical protein